ncbi:MAG: hypothetical protein KBS91_03760, partial [Firmicutes bacterium]|nr:hypothetical protein [Candidatus Caballimonas caccae]
MKSFITGKLKIWVIITLVLIVAGMFVFGFVGYNKSIDYKDSYEVQVKVFSIENAKETAQTETEKYFKEKNLSFKEYASSIAEDSEGYAVLTYKFKSDITSFIDLEELKGKIEVALSSLNLQTEESISIVKGSEINKTGYLALALGLSVVAIFIYLIFMEKFASTIATICSMIISVLLFISIATFVRVPMYPFNDVSLSLTALLTVMLSSGLVARFREETKNVANAKKTSFEIADKVATLSLLRYIVIFVSVLVASLVLIILGKG